jgi:UDP-3-O-[3-hydroxymyristoyl] glucosamine N-acyltransferase
MNVQEIAGLVGGAVFGDAALVVERPGAIESAKAGDLVFLNHPKFEKFVATTGASAILVSRAFDANANIRPGRALIAVDDPYFAFALCMREFAARVDTFPPGVHPTAVVSPSATLGANVSLGAYCVIGDRVRVGEGTVMHPGVIVAADAEIGKNCVIEARAIVYQRCKIGDRCILRAGCVIGAEGFGNVKNKEGRYEHIPQLGTVVLEDDVDVGSNSTIARATATETRIARGVKIDCLVHIAHNCYIGENSAFAAQGGVAGSVVIGKNCTFGGQVGVAGHLDIADGVTVSAQSGVTGPLRLAGETYIGFPAVPVDDGRRRYGAFAKLPEMRDEIRRLRAELDALRERLEDADHSP